MSRLRVTIDHVVFNGLAHSERASFLESLQRELSQHLSAAARPGSMRSHVRPVLKLDAMAFTPGAAGGKHLGSQVARAIGKGIKP